MIQELKEAMAQRQTLAATAESIFTSIRISEEALLSLRNELRANQNRMAVVGEKISKMDHLRTLKLSGQYGEKCVVKKLLDSTGLYVEMVSHAKLMNVVLTGEDAKRLRDLLNAFYPQEEDQ